MKILFKNILVSFVSVCLVLFSIEAILHLFPVNEGLHTQPVNDYSPILHFKKDRTSTWSRFPDFSMTNTVHSNNYGFINNQDYALNSRIPLIAVIGDSYVEAAMIPYKKTVHGILAQKLRDKWRVYSFGASGAPLSQYLAFAKYARETFAPKKMVFLIITNDFDESSLEYKAAPGLHYFKKTPSDRLELTRIDYAPTILTRLFRNSKLMMYLFTNLNIQHNLSNLFNRSTTPVSVGQTSVVANDKRVKLSQKIIKEFFKLLPTYAQLEKKDILFVVDGLRPHLYTKAGRLAAKGSYAFIMRNFFIETAKAYSYPILDLSEYFIEDYTKHHTRFEFEHDGHWNSYAHALVAEILVQNYR